MVRDQGDMLTICTNCGGGGRVFLDYEIGGKAKQMRKTNNSYNFLLDLVPKSATVDSEPQIGSTAESSDTVAG